MHSVHGVAPRRQADIPFAHVDALRWPGNAIGSRAIPRPQPAAQTLQQHNGSNRRQVNLDNRLLTWMRSTGIPLVSGRKKMMKMVMSTTQPAKLALQGEGGKNNGAGEAR